jgi:hypothetical protein
VKYSGSTENIEPSGSQLTNQLNLSLPKKSFPVDGGTNDFLVRNIKRKQSKLEEIFNFTMLGSSALLECAWHTISEASVNLHLRPQYQT